MNAAPIPLESVEALDPTHPGVTDADVAACEARADQMFKLLYGIERRSPRQTEIMERWRRQYARFFAAHRMRRALSDTPDDEALLSVVIDALNQAQTVMQLATAADPKTQETISDADDLVTDAKNVLQSRRDAIEARAQMEVEAAE